MGQEIELDKIPTGNDTKDEMYEKVERLKANLRPSHPVGSKFLLELIVEDIDGWFLASGAMYDPKFKDLTGCTVSKIYAGLELEHDNFYNFNNLNDMSDEELIKRAQKFTDDISARCNALKMIQDIQSRRLPKFKI